MQTKNQELDQPSRTFEFSEYLEKTTNKNKTVVVEVTLAASGKPSAVRHAVKSGLRFTSYLLLKRSLKKRDVDMSQLLGINPRTLNRRKTAARFNTEESDRIVRYAYLQDAAIQLFEGDESRALQWLDRPLTLLGNESPLVHANTEVGAKEVEKLIGRLEHSVFS